jgi:RNA polymerase sigma factor (TIGR02999 family)
MGEDNGDVTQLLLRWGKGEAAALDSLVPIVHAELRRIADAYLRRERTGHTLQPTALVNEAWVRLIRNHPDCESRKHFFALAAQAMRQILVDYSREARASKRGGGSLVLKLGDAVPVKECDFEQFLALNQALDQLAQVSPRHARVIEMRYFGGLNLEEIADLLSLSAATISREQRLAEAWLSRAMADS